MENPRKLDGRHTSVNDRVQHMRNLRTSRKNDDGNNSLLCNGDLPPVINENRLGSIGQRKSMKNALEWFDTVRPERKDSNSVIRGQLEEKVSENETCLIRVKPLQRSPLKAFPGKRLNSAKNHSKYRENLRESQTIRSRMHDSFLRCWNQAQRSIALTEESRDLVPLKKAEIFEYEDGENRGKFVHLEKQGKRANVDLCHPLLHPFLDERRENPQGVIEMNREAIVIYRRNGNRRINDWQNYQFQQIAIGKAKLDLQPGDETKRSSSETRRKISPRHMCIKRSRRSKFHCEPIRLGRSVSIEFKKFDEIREMFHPEESNSILGRSENSFLWKSNEFRLRSTAEKKLNLFKEMKKSGRHRRRKFQEAKALNHRYAITESSYTRKINGNEETVDDEEDGKRKDTFRGDNEETVESAQAEGQGPHNDSNERESSAFLSDEDNNLRTAHYPETPRDVINELTLHGLRDILDDLNSDGEKIEESSSTPREDCTAVGKLTADQSELEELMLKLKTSLKKCTETLKTEETKFYEGTRISDLLTPNDEFLGVIPRSVPPIIAYPASAARSFRSGSEFCRRNEESASMPRCKIVRYNWEPGERLRRADSPHPYGVEPGRLVMTAVSQGAEGENEVLHRVYSLTEASETLSDKLPESKSKKSERTRSIEPESVYCSEFPPYSGRTVPGGRSSGRGVESKICKLEAKLRDILRKVRGCHPSDQIAIKKFMERLRETSEAVLKRLKSDRFCGDRGDICGDLMQRGYQSEPDSAVRANSSKTPIILKTSGSEIQLNVGMEITMENFDPKTGEKLLPEENRDFEQQGNIQCKLVKPGEKPVTFIDTDFLYNPKTGGDQIQENGMLFQKGQKVDRQYRSKELKESPNSTRTFLFSKTSKRNFLADTDSENYSRKLDAHNREETLQYLKTVNGGDRSTSPETSKSVLADPFALAIEREEAKNRGHLRNGMETSRTYPREKSKCAGRPCKRMVFLKPTLKHGGREISTQGMLKIVGDKKTEQTYLLHDRPQAKKRGSYQEETIMVSDKGIQTNLGPRRKSSLELITRKSTGIQAEMKNKNKILVNRSADTTFLGTPLWALRRGVNVSVQTSFMDILLKVADVSSQTDFLSGEAQKYMKDLETQKKLAKLFSYTWTFGFFICKLVYYMQSVSAICSVLTLTAMSVERYYAIVHPMRAQYVCTISQARRIITFTWISSFFLAIPVLFAQIHMPVGVRVKGFWCVRDYDNPTIWRAHETYMLLLILIIPTGVMGVAYTTICLEIWQVMQRRQDLTSAKILNIRYNKTPMNPDDCHVLGKEKRQQRNTYGESPDDEVHVKQVIKMLVAVVVIYVVCWGPLLIDNLLQAYGVLPFMKFGKQKYMATAFHLMAYFNSCINPIVYGFMSKNFRESFHKTLCCTTRKGHTSVRNTSVSHDRNTSIRYAESSFGRTVSIAMPD